jgi:hypothetical protein
MILPATPGPFGPNPKSPSDQRQQHWKQIYESKPYDQVSWYQAVPRISMSLIHSSGVSPTSRIIDVGGGASTLVDCLLKADYRSIAVLDLAAGALEQSKQRLGPAAAQVDWIAADILSWQLATRFHLWHDRAVFHFLTQPEDRQAYLATLRAALLPGATVILATFALEGPERCSGLPVRRYSPQTLAAELGSEFTLVEAETEDHPTPSGAEQRFVYCRFKR